MLKLSLFLLLTILSSLSNACTGITSDRKFLIKVKQDYKNQSIEFKMIRISTMETIRDFRTKRYKLESGGSYQPDVLRFYDSKSNHYSFVYGQDYGTVYSEGYFIDTDYKITCI